MSKMVRDDLRLVGKIRNIFAHDLYASFEKEPIRSWCIGLQFHRDVYMEPPEGVSARDLFYVGLHKLVGYLGGIVSVTRAEKRTIHR